MELTIVERWMLSNQFKMMESMYPKDAKYFAEAREVVEKGFSLFFSHYCEHIETPLSEDDCHFVMNAMDMFDSIHRCYKNLNDKNGIDQSRVIFGGFDRSSQSNHHAFCKWLKEHDRFTELPISASPMSGVGSQYRYPPMIAEWEESSDKYNLSKNDIIRILEAR